MGALRVHWEWDLRAESLEKINNYIFLKTIHEEYGKNLKKRAKQTATYGRQSTNICIEWGVPSNE